MLRQAISAGVAYNIAKQSRIDEGIRSQLQSEAKYHAAQGNPIRAGLASLFGGKPEKTVNPFVQRMAKQTKATQGATTKNIYRGTTSAAVPTGMAKPAINYKKFDVDPWKKAS